MSRIRARVGATARFYRALLARHGWRGVVAYLYRQVFVLRVHQRLLDARVSGREPAVLRRIVAPPDLGVESPSVVDAVKYEPTPALLVRWVHRLLPIDVAGWTFLDVGAGRGRTLAVAAQHPYRALLGVDISPALVRDANTYLAQLPPALVRGRRIEVATGDARELDLPDAPTVVYLFNPFGGAVFEAFAERLHAATARVPLVVVYVNPQWRSVLDRSSGLEQVTLPRRWRVVLALLSPYSVAVYRSPLVSTR